MNAPIQRPGPGTSVTVLGMARSGIAAAGALLKLGCAVRVSEQGKSLQIEAVAKDLMAAGAGVEIGGHSKDFIQGAQLVVLSPGIPMSAPPIRWARGEGIPVVSELELGSWYCPGRMVAVTGSNGKSTVVSMLGEILKAAGKERIVCGNIGTPLTGVLSRISSKTIVVLEVSSFQLEANLSFHTDIACVLNVTDNHLDRHGSFKEYQEIKGRLFEHQTRSSWALVNSDDPGSSALRPAARGELVSFSRKRKVAGAYGLNGALHLDLPSLAGKICPKAALPWAGGHLVENALAASCMAGLLGVPPAVSGRALRSFRGLPHRQEWVGQLRGVTFINDSKSTTVASGISAIQAAPGRVVLIAGGRDKGGDFRQLKPWMKKLRGAVLIGEDGPKIAHCLKGSIPLKTAGSLWEAVQAAFRLAQKGECVLLSPMCTSFDMFHDFEDRGEKFVQAVKAMEA